MNRPKLTITFPTDEHRDDFLAWLSDGGGEYIYMEGQTDERSEIVKFDYSDAFEAWGKKDDSDPIVHTYTE